MGGALGKVKGRAEKRPHRLEADNLKSQRACNRALLGSAARRQSYKPDLSGTLKPSYRKMGDKNSQIFIDQRYHSLFNFNAKQLFSIS